MKHRSMYIYIFWNYSIEFNVHNKNILFQVLVKDRLGQSPYNSDDSVLKIIILDVNDEQPQLSMPKGQVQSIEQTEFTC